MSIDAMEPRVACAGTEPCPLLLLPVCCCAICSARSAAEGSRGGSCGSAGCCVRTLGSPEGSVLRRPKLLLPSLPFSCRRQTRCTLVGGACRAGRRKQRHQPAVRASDAAAKRTCGMDCEPLSLSCALLKLLRRVLSSCVSVRSKAAGGAAIALLSSPMADKPLCERRGWTRCACCSAFCCHSCACRRHLSASARASDSACKALRKASTTTAWGLRSFEMCCHSTKM